MNAGRKDGTVRMKLTISREEHPAMFEALALEQVGATAALGPLLLDGARPGVAPGRETARAVPPATPVALMLEWDESTT